MHNSQEQMVELSERTSGHQLCIGIGRIEHEIVIYSVISRNELLYQYYMKMRPSQNAKQSHHII